MKTNFKKFFIREQYIFKKNLLEISLSYLSSTIFIIILIHFLGIFENNQINEPISIDKNLKKLGLISFFLIFTSIQFNIIKLYSIDLKENISENYYLSIFESFVFDIIRFCFIYIPFLFIILFLFLFYSAHISLSIDFFMKFIIFISSLKITIWNILLFFKYLNIKNIGPQKIFRYIMQIILILINIPSIILTEYSPKSVLMFGLALLILIISAISNYILVIFLNFINFE